MSFDKEALERHIPYYLSEADKHILTRELESIGSGSKAYSLSSYRDEFESSMLQGDGWKGFTIYSFPNQSERSIKALILSNSCDIDPSNSRDVSTRITYAPIAALSKYEDALKEAKLSEQSIKNKIDAIKRQEVTSIFYIPADNRIEFDLIIRFDQIFSAPISIIKSANPEKLFTLSNTGFYLLALKLSVHFCRLHENIKR